MAAAVVKVISMLTLYYASLTSANNLLHCNYYGNCICPGDIVAFVCSVSGGAATVWKGSIFTDCPDTGESEIILSHRRFEHGITKTCNDGAVIAYSTEVINNSYSSQLNMTVHPEMQNGTIECIEDGLNETSVGACTLILATEPPNDVHLSDINPNQFTIDWSPLASNCPVTTHYGIATSNCGVCPNATSNTFIRCTNLVFDGQVCSIVIQTMTCENSSELSATNLTILLQVPSAPDVTARWMNQFFSILTSFNETERFFISNGFDGSATNYTITYSDPTSGRTCDSVTISASACTSGQCNHMFDIPSACSNFNTIVITVFASNILGDGPSSEPVLLEFKTSDTPSIALYSIVGGSSIAVILSLLLVIIILASFLKKIYTSFQRPRNNPEQEIYTSLEPIAISGDREIESVNTYTDLVQPVDKTTESCEVTEECIIYENNYHEIDKTLSLDNLLIQIRHEVTPKWYKFGLAVGINNETLDEFSNFPPEECIVEISDLWLRTSETTVTWRDVADALKEIGCHRLAERILKVYKTGILPGDQEAIEVVMPLEQSSITSNGQDDTSESS